MGTDAGAEELPAPIDRARIDVSQADRTFIDDTGDVAVLPPDDASVGMDGALIDGARADSGPTGMDVTVDTAAMMGLDVPEMEVSLPSQTCAWVSPSVAFGSGGRGVRPVFVRSDMTGFAAGASVLRDGADNVWIQRVTREGTPTIVGNASGAMAGAMVRGGALARESMFLLFAWSQSQAGAEQVFLQRVQDNFLPVMGSRAQVTMSGTHQDPQLSDLRRGYMLAWRTLSGGRGSITTAPFDLGTVGAPTALTSAGSDVTSFKLVTSQPADVYAVVFREANAIRVQRVTSAGAAMGAPVDVAAGADLGDTVDAVLEDDGDLWVTWAQPAAGGTIRLRRIGLGTGAGTGAEVNLVATTGGAQPGISLDGSDLAIAFRSLGDSPATLDLVRVRASDGSVRDRSRLGAVGPGGRVGIEVRDGRYGVGWSDDFASGAVTRIGVASCR